MCVCVSVCPPGYLNFCACCLWPWLVPPPASWRNPKVKGQFWGFFFFIDNALYSVAFGTHTKKLNWSRCHLGLCVGLTRRTVCYVGGNFRGNMCPTSLLLRIIANLTGHAASHDRGRRFIASVGRVYYRPQRGGIAHHGRSLISTIALFCYYAVFSLCLCICFIFYVLVCTSTLLFRIPTESAVLFIFK